MPLGGVVDAFRDHLASTLDPVPPLLGGAHPAVVGQLPAVAIALADVADRLRGLGAKPAAVETGALRIETTLSLADPVVEFPGERVRLLSDDRRLLHLPHGSVVGADGTVSLPFDAADLLVELNGAAVPLVAGAPAAGQVQVEPNLGELRFGTALPAAGTLRLRYFIGQWDVRTERYQGTVAIEPFATDAGGVDALTRQVEEALADERWREIRGLRSLSPRSFGPVRVLEGAVGPGQRDAHSRQITYAFDFELIEPIVRTGGGLIGTVAVDSTYGAERFEVTRERSTA
jgi:hypothetical protein